MQTKAIYGAAPADLGLIDLHTPEMMLWLYCPVKIPNWYGVILPDNLGQFFPILQAVRKDCEDKWFDSYVYLSAKTLYVKPGDAGNRPGWHSDGFLTDDLNYIWSTANPTVIWEPGKLVSFTADHSVSLVEMELAAEADPSTHRRYPNKHLLRLDQTVLHKVEQDIKPGVRTFVKVSVSKDKYALEGNSINHSLGVTWDLKPRLPERNCPVLGAAA